MHTNKFPKIIRTILAYRRKSRVDYVLSKINKKLEMLVIDIGCGPDGRSFSDYIPETWKIYGIDILPDEKVNHRHNAFTYERISAANLDIIRDYQYDLAISIGMLEHITDEKTFMLIVQQIKRVAKQYIVIVPFKYALIEPHFGIPLFPIIPYKCKLLLVKIFNINNLRSRIKENPNYINEHYRWLSNSEYKQIFPDSTVFILPTYDVIAIIKKNTN